MIEVSTMAEALAVPNLIHIEAGNPVKAWQQGDTLPAHLIVTQPTAAEVIAAVRAAAKAAFDAQRETEMALRAVVVLVTEEMNAMKTRVNQIMTAVDNGGTYAAAKTTIAALTDLQTRTLAQARTAILNKIDAGEAD